MPDHSRNHRRIIPAVCLLALACAGCGGDDEQISEQAELTPEEAGVTTEDFHWETPGEEVGLPTGAVSSVELTPDELWVVAEGRLYRSPRTDPAFSPVDDAALPTGLERVEFGNGVLWALGRGAAYSADLGAGWRAARLPDRDDGDWTCFGADLLGDDAYLGTDGGLLHDYSFNPRGNATFQLGEPLMGNEIGHRRITDVCVADGTVWVVSPDEYGFLAKLDAEIGRWTMVHPYDPFNRVEVSGERVWVGSAGLGIFRSDDGGESFYEVNPGGDWKNVNGIALGVGAAWAASDGGAIYYPYGEGQWEFHGVQEGADFGAMADVAFDEEANTAYFATPQGLAVGVKEGPPAPDPEALEEAAEEGASGEDGGEAGNPAEEG
jgi:hypothetical protein